MVNGENIVRKIAAAIVGGSVIYGDRDLRTDIDHVQKILQNIGLEELFDATLRVTKNPTESNLVQITLETGLSIKELTEALNKIKDIWEIQ